jgi:hypothetical protein
MLTRPPPGVDARTSIGMGPRGGQLKSRAVSRMSEISMLAGGLTALLYGLRAHQEACTRTWAETNVSVVFNADEERLSPTSREVIGQEAGRAHSVGILEPARPGGEYVMARKGAGTFQLEVTGKAAHAGLQPELGASAIWDLAQKVTALCLWISTTARRSTPAPCGAVSAQRRRRPRRRRDRSAGVEWGGGRGGHRRHAEDLRPAARGWHDGALVRRGELPAVAARLARHRALAFDHAGGRPRARRGRARHQDRRRLGR